MKENEIWMKKLKEKLGDYTEPTPASGWEQLEKELLSSSVPEKRILPYRRWVAAASVLLVLASSVSLYFLYSPVADEIRQTPVPVLAVAPDIMPVKQEPALQVAKAEPMKASRTTTGTVRQSLLAVERTEENPPVVIIESNNEPTVIAESGETEKAAVEHVTPTQSHEKEVRKPSGRDKLHLPETTANTSRGRWAIGASVSNAGAISGSIDGGGLQPQASARLDISSSSIIPIPGNQMVVFKEGVPYIQRTDEITDIKHRQPISFGLSVRKELPKGFSVETGLTYTLLSSDVKLSGSSEMQDQKLHYIGIPLRTNWNFVDTKLFTVYLAAGGAVEKCVYGNLGNEKQTVKPLQLSVMGAVGAQVNATKQLGIYVEPGVAYFFNDGSPVQTIRKETPCNFNLQAGVRFTY